MDIECYFCHAFHWKAEALTSSTINNSKFGMCCYQGKISLSDLQHVLYDLFDLFTCNDSVSSAFYQHILFYNNALAITLVGKTIDSSVN